MCECHTLPNQRGERKAVRIRTEHLRFPQEKLKKLGQKVSYSRNIEKKSSSNGQLQLIYMSSLLSDSSSLMEKSTTESSFENKIRIVIYGPPESGKSTLVLQLTKNKVSNYYMSSIFTEVVKKDFQFEDKSYLFEFIVPKNSENSKIIESNCYFIVFDLSDISSFISAEKFLREKLKTMKKPIYFIGNKCEKNRVVEQNKIHILCKEFNLQFYEISALFGMGLRCLLRTIKERLF